MPPSLSPRAQEILDAIERDTAARRDTPSPQGPETAGSEAAVAGTEPAALLELVDALTAQAEQARMRLTTLTSALREVEQRLDEAEAPGDIESARTTGPGDTGPPVADPSPDTARGPSPSRLTVTDLHHHLLPGVDDGPATLADSLALARAAVAAGTTTVVVTPHVSWDYPATTAASIAAGVAALTEAMAAEGIPLRVLAGAEVAVTRAVDLPDEELVALRLGGGPYLLVECPFTPSAVGFEFLLEALLVRGHRLLLAHPERSPAFQRDPELLERLVARGVLAQLTAGSLTGGFGRTVRDFAHRLLDDGLAHVVASDSHSVERRPPSVLAELEREGYAGLAAWLVDGVPRAILDGGPIPPRPMMPVRPRSGFKRLLGR